MKNRDLTPYLPLFTNVERGFTLIGIHPEGD
jgi:hypothetical protein